MAGRAAVFVDRDDTLNKDCPYCSKPEQIALLPTVAEGVRLLNDAGLPVVVVTNQSGIARGRFTEADLAAVHDRLRDLLAAQGARLDGIYHCPHLPDYGCPDRKPAPGLALRAARDLGLDVANSAVVGDRFLDLQLARNLGALAVLVPSPQTEPAARDAADLVAGSFLEAARWVAGMLAEK